NPHFWRTHDGGKTWTEINAGISRGAVANSIREDPRTRGLLYAATDVQVWVSYDDGDRWESLKLDMPAISVRDIQVKDDDSCLCADLVAGTHGRGFWILDDITPLRQHADAEAAPDCALPLYWPAPPIRLSTRAWFHRFTWDLRFDPLGEDPDQGDEGATGAVPHRTYELPYSPWAPPGTYTVRLTVDGRRYEQPIALRLDPRVNMSAAALTELNTLTRELYDAAVLAHNAYAEARALVARVADAALKAKIEAIAPPESATRRPRGFGGGGPGGAGGAAQPT